MADRPRRVVAEAVLGVGPKRMAVVLGDRALWVRVASAAGAVVDAHPATSGPVADGDLLRLRRRGRAGRPGARSLILRAERPDPAAPPAWTVVAGPKSWRRIAVLVTAAGEGTRVVVDCDTAGTALVRRHRRAVTAAARLLLGLLDSTARAPRLVVAAAITRSHQGRAELLVGRCPSGEWELPGGKVEPRESEVEALTREIVEELGVRITVGGRVGRPVDLGDGLELRCLRGVVDDGQPPPQAREHIELRWVTADDLADLPWRPADRDWVPDLRRLLTDD